MNVLAIDPGNEYSGYAIIDQFYKPLAFGKVKNQDLEEMLSNRGFLDSYEGSVLRDRSIVTPDIVTIEMVASYGMSVGQTVFLTCVEIGRLSVLCEKSINITPQYVKRKEYVTELCGSAKAKDCNVIQYLIDRFAPDTENRGKGTKKEPGWFYGFKADVWQAYAIAVWTLDEVKRNEKRKV